MTWTSDPPSAKESDGGATDFGTGRSVLSPPCSVLIGRQGAAAAGSGEPTPATPANPASHSASVSNLRACSAASSASLEGGRTCFSVNDGRGFRPPRRVQTADWRWRCRFSDDVVKWFCTTFVRVASNTTPGYTHRRRSADNGSASFLVGAGDTRCSPLHAGGRASPTGPTPFIHESETRAHRGADNYLAATFDCLCRRRLMRP